MQVRYAAAKRPCTQRDQRWSALSRPLRQVFQVHAIAQACLELYLQGSPLDDCLEHGVQAAREAQLVISKNYKIGVFDDYDPAIVRPLEDRFITQVYRLIHMEKEAVAIANATGVPVCRYVIR